MDETGIYDLINIFSMFTTLVYRLENSNFGKAGIYIKICQKSSLSHI